MKGAYHKNIDVDAISEDLKSSVIDHYLKTGTAPKDVAEQIGVRERTLRKHAILWIMDRHVSQKEFSQLIPEEL